MDRGWAKLITIDRTGLPGDGNGEGGGERVTTINPFGTPPTLFGIKYLDLVCRQFCSSKGPAHSRNAVGHLEHKVKLKTFVFVKTSFSTCVPLSLAENPIRQPPCLSTSSGEAYTGVPEQHSGERQGGGEGGGEGTHW